MTVNDWARLLVLLSMFFAIAGVMIALTRVMSNYRRAMALPNTRAESDRFAQRAREEARGDLGWTAIESGLVLIGIVLAGIASILLIP